MRRMIIALLVACCCIPAGAQHLDFCGVELTGNIREFPKKMEEKGFKLKQKRSDDDFYIFEGRFCGQKMFVNIHYTPKSHTVYQARVTPRNVNEEQLLDSMLTTYGSDFESKGESYQWVRENGGIFYIQKNGFDPYIIFMDAEGMALMKKEN
ncbi:MAG: hypothetical protein II645_07980 [Bacteroidaceae bacterium]|nr:hypothetical protein [Bacteroidaceae bacterium]MBQ2595836.1 hypothetical protein [Bacteroidaceae bacterium]MBQ3993076.1 hypothetical protein [Bacteroidaceae bacterium]